MQLFDTNVFKFFWGDNMRMANTYNLTTHHAEGMADVCSYTAVIEFVNSVLEVLYKMKAINLRLYSTNYQ